MEKEKLWGQSKAADSCRGMNKYGTGKVSGNENTQYDTVVADACHYTFVQTQNERPSEP